MHITKDKLPKGVSHILKSSVFEKALDDADIPLDTSVHHVSGGIFFDPGDNSKA